MVVSICWCRLNEPKEQLMTITLSSIGTVSSPVHEGVDEGWGSVTSRIDLNPELRGSLLGLEDFSHVLVVFWMHQSRFDSSQLVRHPQGKSELPEIGIFAQRAKHRPNPIGVTAVELISVEEQALTVRGLDAIDGTPVLDIKPYFPEFDRVSQPRVPTWCAVIMDPYF